MKISPSRVLRALACLALAGTAQAGSYVKDFTGLADGSTNLGDGSFVGSNDGRASVQTGRLRLTQNGTGGTAALYRLPDLDPGLEISGFHVEFDLALNTSGGASADGVSLNFGGLLLTDTTGPGEEGYQLPGGMVVSFDTYINSPPETVKSIDVRIDGTQIASVPESTFGNFNLAGVNTRVVIDWNNGKLNMTYGATTICSNVSVPGLKPLAGDRFAFSARTGGVTEDVFLDNLNITTTPQSPITRPNVALSEMVVDNTVYEDEHNQKPGYVELYNGTNAPVSLNGWSLTNDATVPAKWAFPAGQTIPAFGYLVVFFDHGTPVPTAADTRLHTNFKPVKTGGFLGLYNGATKIDSFEPYPAQVENVSYGHLNQAWTLGFLETPTPGGKNTGLQAAGPPVKEEVTWPRDGGLITGPITLTLGAPTTAGGQIRYTLDNNAPDGNSTLYDHTTPGTITVNGTANVRARIFAPNRLPGKVTSRTFLKVDSSLTNYRGTGQPFNSNLPLILIDSFGRSIDSENSTVPGARSYRYTYAVVLDRDPANGNRARVTPTAPINFQGRGGMRVRGESSAGMPQRQYAWETWDNEGNDKDVSILGMPADSDWVLYGPATDKTLLRNFIAYNTMRDTDGQGSAMRTRLVEVFFNQPVAGGTAATDASAEMTYGDYRGVYVLVEKIKRGNDRVDIVKLEASDTDPSLISGGYIFKKDKPSTDPDFTTNGGQLLQVVEPEVSDNDPQWTWLRNYVNTFEAALNGANFADPTTGYRAYIEESTFMDNQWWVEVYKQIDGYRLSTYFTKDRGGKIKSAPLWDYNLSMGNADYLEGYKYYGWYHTQVGAGDYQFYNRLRQDPYYTLRHWDRFWKLRKGTFATASMVSRIDGYINEVTDGQPLVNITNGTGVWPNSVPSAEVPAARHHARWQRLGAWDWPNAPGWSNRSKYTSTTDATDYANLAANGYAYPATSDDTQVQTPAQATFGPVMSETTHLKSHITNRLRWIDNGYLNGTTILRPPVLSQEGGNVPSGFNLTIAPYSGTVPAAADYGLTGTLAYASGPIYYTTNGDEIYATGSTTGYAAIPENAALQVVVPSSAAWDTQTSLGLPAPNDTLTAPAWALRGFADTGTWQTGAMGVGYDNSRAPAVDYAPEITTFFSTPTFPVGSAQTMFNVNQTCYVRIPFNLTAGQIAGVTRLLLRAKYDDGFIAYLNGVKIVENRAPAGVPAYNSGATSIHDDPLALVWEDQTIINQSAAIAALTPGQNVLALHGLNSGVGSSDFLLKATLNLLSESVATTASAKLYTGPVPLTAPTLVRARQYNTATSSWTPVTEATFVVSTVPASASNLVVSEIMYNPSEPTAGEIAAGFNDGNMFEYIELMNIGSSAIDLSGVSFTTGITFTWPTSDPTLRTLAAGARVILAGNVAAFNFRYHPGVDVKVAGAYTGNLSNGGEQLVLTGTSGAVIKDFTYDDVDPWPLEPDGGGYSLVLNNPASNPDANLPWNWRSSAGVNGTPGLPPGAAGPTGSSAAALADSDGDGISDLLEYAMGTQPSNGASRPALVSGTQSFTVPPSTTAVPYLTFEYRRSRSADGFSLEPEVSSTLGTWQPLSTQFTLVSQTNNADGTSTVKWRSNQPVSAIPSRLFFHLRAGILP